MNSPTPDPAPDACTPASADRQVQILLRHVPPEELPASEDLYSAVDLEAHLGALAERPFSLAAVGDIMLGDQRREFFAALRRTRVRQAPASRSKGGAGSFACRASGQATARLLPEPPSLLLSSGARQACRSWRRISRRDGRLPYIRRPRRKRAAAPRRLK